MPQGWQLSLSYLSLKIQEPWGQKHPFPQWRLGMGQWEETLELAPKREQGFPRRQEEGHGKGDSGNWECRGESQSVGQKMGMGRKDRRSVAHGAPGEGGFLEERAVELNVERGETLQAARLRRQADEAQRYLGGSWGLLREAAEQWLEPIACGLTSYGRVWPWP